MTSHILTIFQERNNNPQMKNSIKIEIEIESP